MPFLYRIFCTIVILSFVSLISSECISESPINEVCSGRGKCINNVCICDDAWTGVGDLIDRNGTDCNNHKKTVIALYSISLITWIIALIMGLYKLIKSIIYCYYVSKSSENHGKSIIFKFIKTYLTLPGAQDATLFVIASTCEVTIQAIRVVGNNEYGSTIGYNRISTILFFFGISLYWSTGYVVVYHILKAHVSISDLQHGDKIKSKQHIQQLKVLLHIGNAITTACGIPYLYIHNVNSSDAKIYAIVMYVSSAIACGSIGIVLFYFGRKMISILQSNQTTLNEQQRIQRELVIKKMTILSKYPPMLTISTVISILLVAGMDIIRARSSFVLPINWIFAATAGIIVMPTIQIPKLSKIQHHNIQDTTSNNLNNGSPMKAAVIVEVQHSQQIK